MQVFYHGSPDSKKILEQGIDILHPKRTDAGDFGWGLYLTKNPKRAKVHGSVLVITIDDARYAYIPNPYFLEITKKIPPQTPIERLFYQLAFDAQGNMKTLHGTPAQRENVSKHIREVFLAQGYSGITTNRADQETVVFDAQTIKKIEPYLQKNPSHQNFLDWLQTQLSHESLAELEMEAKVELLNDHTAILTGPEGIQHSLDSQQLADQGWYLSSSDSFDGNIELTFHTILGPELNNPPEVLYHVSRNRDLPKILADELTPRTGKGSKHRFRYPPRIFLTNDPSTQTDVGFEMGEEITILAVKTSQLNQKFYEDPEFPGDGWQSSYVIHPIPSEAIRQIAKLPYNSTNLEQWQKFKQRRNPDSEFQKIESEWTLDPSPENWQRLFHVHQMNGTPLIVSFFSGGTEIGKTAPLYLRRWITIEVLAMTSDGRYQYKILSDFEQFSGRPPSRAPVWSRYPIYGADQPFLGSLLPKHRKKNKELNESDPRWDRED